MPLYKLKAALSSTWNAFYFCFRIPIFLTIIFLLYEKQTFYCWARDAAVGVTKRITESDSEVPEVKVCTAASRLMLQILNWDFRYNTSATKASIDVFSSVVRADSSSLKRSECTVVQVNNSYSISA